jgi:hypothetical protein
LRKVKTGQEKKALKVLKKNSKTNLKTTTQRESIPPPERFSHMVGSLSY